MFGRLIAFLWSLWYRLRGQEAVRLNLRVGMDLEHNRAGAWYAFYFKGKFMAKIGDTFTASIAPTNAKGDPAPVFEVSFSEDSECYDVVSVAADGLSAVLVAVAAGTGLSVFVRATTKGGAVLTDTKPLPDVVVPVDDEAVALNLSVA